MIEVFKGGLSIWAVFIAFLAFGGYVLLIPIGIFVLFAIKMILDGRKRKNAPLAKRNLIRRSD